MGIMKIKYFFFFVIIDFIISIDRGVLIKCSGKITSIKKDQYNEMINNMKSIKLLKRKIRRVLSEKKTKVLYNHERNMEQEKKEEEKKEKKEDDISKAKKASKLEKENSTGNKT